MYHIPQIEITPENLISETNVVINLNHFLWLNRDIESHLQSHRRLLPAIHVSFPDGKIINFAYPRYFGADIVFVGGKRDQMNLTLTFQ